MRFLIYRQLRKLDCLADRLVMVLFGINEQFSDVHIKYFTNLSQQSLDSIEFNDFHFQKLVSDANLLINLEVSKSSSLYK